MSFTVFSICLPFLTLGVVVFSTVALVFLIVFDFVALVALATLFNLASFTDLSTLFSLVTFVGFVGFVGHPHGNHRCDDKTGLRRPSLL